MTALRRLGVVMDPIGAISYAKDSTLAMLLAAQARGFALAYLEQRDLLLRDGVAFGRMRALTVRAERDAVAQRSEEHTSELQSRFDLVCRLLLEKKKEKNDTTHNTTHSTHH